MPDPNLPLPCNIAVEYWQASGERTEARLRTLVAHFVRVYGMLDELAVLQEKTVSSIPRGEFEQR